jgi:predicted nucleotidyltransferase
VEPVQALLAEAAADLDAIGARWAIIGGLAVSFRTEPRFTKDVDFAVAVASDQEAEALVNRLQVRGYALSAVVEQEYVSRLATARLVRPVQGGSSAFLDLLFASSGIEPETVTQADRVEVLPGMLMPVASIAHLIALKVLAGRAQDLTDLQQLIAVASAKDVEEARAAVRLIEQRGFSRELDLSADLDEVIRAADPN